MRIIQAGNNGKACWRGKNVVEHHLASRPLPVKVYDKHGKLVKTINNFRKELDHYEIIND